mmetsp:Transcript_11568/g.44906  ORF Transcript_11568/g.44906 Transcript_11568/m.44906 type:complete len:280 (-) Transcript_11568:210-1049(-)
MADLLDTRSDTARATPAAACIARWAHSHSDLLTLAQDSTAPCSAVAPPSPSSASATGAFARKRRTASIPLATASEECAVPSGAKAAPAPRKASACFAPSSGAGLSAASPLWDRVATVLRVASRSDEKMTAAIATRDALPLAVTLLSACSKGCRSSSGSPAATPGAPLVTAPRRERPPFLGSTKSSTAATREAAPEHSSIDSAPGSFTSSPRGENARMSNAEAASEAMLKSPDAAATCSSAEQLRTSRRMEHLGAAGSSPSVPQPQHRNARSRADTTAPR